MGKTLHLSISDKDLSAATADVHHDHLQSQLDGVVDSISSLEAHQTDIQTSLTSLSSFNSAFQTQITNQLFAFQSLILDELRNIQPRTSTVPPTQPATTSLPHSLSLLATPPPHYASTSHTPQPSPSFRSLFPPATTTYSGLGLSHPPSPALNRYVGQPVFRTRPTHHFTQHTLPLYTTLSPSSLPHLPSPTHYPYLPPTPPFPTTHTSLPALDPLLYHSPSFVKIIKIDLPRFTGKDAYGWLTMAERYLDYYSVPFFQRVTVTACNFGSNASIWMR
ncbi:unnamed protein product [Prunus armeniaca]|uniref:Uncharacterized protein n=1 Tax=Prunus armeniaca TaxID=36596 RepID=A0A6J5UF55_PRUAR|nr:unnamed protein product [Prunus armeniaca]